MRITLILATIVTIGCSKEQPAYSLLRPAAGDRTVLVEEFSGALCPNCPQGTSELESLKDLYGERLVVLTIHAGDFAFPFSDSQFDFSTSEGDELLGILGNPIGYPSAVINRKREGPQGGFQEFSSKWAASIASSLEDSTAVDISLDITFDQATRELAVQVVVLPFENINSISRLTVVIKEDGIIDPQADRADPTGKVEDYVHKNVLRKSLSDPRGDVVSNGLRAFESVSRNYSFSLPQESGWWKAENCSLIAFVTAGSEEVGQVLQAKEAKILPQD